MVFLQIHHWISQKHILDFNTWREKAGIEQNFRITEKHARLFLRGRDIFPVVTQSLGNRPQVRFNPVEVFRGKMIFIVPVTDQRICIRLQSWLRCVPG
jgi:hypothetical protein